MTLKEAFRYMNYLDGLTDAASNFMHNLSFVTTTKRISQKEEGEMTETVDKSVDVDFQPKDVIDFACNILIEKEKLSDAIWAAKRSSDFDLDKMVAINNQKHRVINDLTRLSKVSASTKRQTQGRGYRINANGDQTPYVYDVEEITTIDFDRSKVKKEISKLTKEADSISQQIELHTITTTVEYIPLWEISETMIDILEEEKV